MSNRTPTKYFFYYRSFYKKSAALLLVLSTLLLSSCGDQEPSYPLMDGGTLQFSELKGKTVFINYWAEWCGPCREEMPELNQLQQEMGDQVQVLAVNFDGVTGKILEQQAEEIGIQFPILLTNPRQQFNVKSSGVLPETIVIDAQGVFQKILLGAQSIATLKATMIEVNQIQDENRVD